MWSACEKGNIEVVESKLKDKEIEKDLNKAYIKVTPLYVACQNGHTQIVELMTKDKNLFFFIFYFYVFNFSKNPKNLNYNLKLV